MIRKRLLAAAVLTLAATALTAGSSAAGPSTRDGDPARLLASVSRSTTWTQTSAVPLKFETYHPQGMVRVGDHYFMTSVEVLSAPVKCDPACDGYDRTPGAGVGHLFEFDARGNLLRDLHLGAGTVYHPGGFDYDGRYLWVPVAEYRPNSRATIYRIDPVTFAVQPFLQVPDHIGGVVHDVANNRFLGLNWGARTFYVWGPSGQLQRKTANPEQFVDFQDCHYLQYAKAVCGGVASLAVGSASVQLGGLSLLDLHSLDAVNTVPLTGLTPAGNSITRNPVWLATEGGSLTLQVVPDDDQSVLYTYRAG
ncbi:hypothetical protein FHX82_001874 [Amycolatopsis bartoniae]|uniref:DUF6454 family protein n=1 Tax=Amycolatopsis bartoniae TaxID=941986 RepID=UPI001818C140|nr:DUF6454 family protein [Amycolatopsis bartoniae]MBB2934854.1 hypothetical protein [Amycolatopsis bartoniae]